MVGLKGDLQLCLGQVVGLLLCSQILDNSELAGIAGVPKPVPFCQWTRGTGCDALVSSQVVGALVVFKQDYRHTERNQGK